MLGRSRSMGGSRWGRILIALILARIFLFASFGSKSYNPVTGETQHVNNITPEFALSEGSTP